MLDNPKTLKNAIEIANVEQNLRRFDLRAGNPSQIFHAAGTEPMEVDHAGPSLRCYKCKGKATEQKNISHARPI